MLSEILITSLIANFITLVIAVGGWVFTYKLHNQSKKLQGQAAKIKKLQDEVRARISLEKAACEWIIEIRGGDVKERSVKLEL